jgi:adenylate cyclase
VIEEAFVERRLAAILAGDVVGYSRLMGIDEVGTLRALKVIRRELADPAIASHRGRVVKTTGDGILVEFPSVVDAVACAVAIQDAMVAWNTDVPEDKRIVFRIGINIGDIIVDEADIHGDGVNVAARLEGLSQPGGICISEDAFRQVRAKLDVDFEDMGEHSLKNIARPMRLYRVANGKQRAPAPRSDTIQRTALPLPNKPSIAVLPFQNMSGDPEQEYFADGMVEELTAALSRVRSFFVISRNSAFAYKGRAVDVKQISRELGVRYVLEGSVRKAGGRVRITAQLIDATTGSHIWSDRYDGGIEDIFDLQDSISESVVGAIQPSVLLAEIERSKRKRPDSLDAYDCVLRALPHVWALNPSANATALNHLSHAIQIEPDYPLALSLAAWCQAQRSIYNWTTKPHDAKDEALRLAKLAGDITNDEPMVLTALCGAHTVIGDLDLALALVEKALALDPNSSMGWNRSGWVHAFLIRPEVAIEHFERALRLSPFDPMKFNCLFGIASAHFAAERYEESLSWWRKGMLLRPDLIWPHRPVAACLGQLGRISEAREAVSQLLVEYPGLTISRVMAIPATRDDYARRYAEGLRKAGLPE